MKPKMITYNCQNCDNIHQEIIFSSEYVYELKTLACNKCEGNYEMVRKIEELDEPIGGQVR